MGFLFKSILKSCRLPWWSSPVLVAWTCLSLETDWNYHTGDSLGFYKNYELLNKDVILTHRRLPPDKLFPGICCFFGSKVSENVCLALKSLIVSTSQLVNLEYLAAMPDMAEKIFSNWVLPPNWLSSEAISCLFLICQIQPVLTFTWHEFHRVEGGG